MKLLDKKPLHVLAASACICLSQTAFAAITYSSDFEDYTTGDVENFKIGNIVNGGPGWFPGTYGAPGDYNNGYSAIVDEGGAAQGNQQLSVFTDYNAWSPFTAGPGTTMQTFVSQDMGTLDGADVGETYTFTFDGKLGNIVEDPASQAEAFIKVLKQSDGSYIELANITFDSDALLTGDWSEGNFISLLIDAGMVGELVQIGFNTTATDWAPSGVVYDNLNFASSPVPVPAAAWLFGSALVGLAGIGRKRKV